MTITFKSNLTTKNRTYLEHALEAYNFSKNSYMNPAIYDHLENFGFYAYDQGELVGGAYGSLDDGYWCHLKLLFVEEAYRNQNIATRLMQQVEEFAHAHHCMGIRTETWSFQARGFYEKLGFVLYGQLDNHPPTATEYLLKKVLITNTADFPAPLSL